MKKIILGIFAIFYIFFPLIVFTKLPPSYSGNTGNSQLTPFPVTCYCSYLVVDVDQTSEEYLDLEAFKTNFYEIVFQTTILKGSAFSTPSVEEQIAKCTDEARKKGLSNAQCTNEKTVTMTELKEDYKFKAPELTVKIPGFSNFSPPPIVWDKESGTVYFTWLGEYIKALYTFGITIISILAAIMIIISGIKVIFSGFGGEKKEAYKRITQAVIGLILAWSSYAILYFINPNLLQFKGLEVQIIAPQDIKSIVDGDADNGEGVEGAFSADETCIPLNELVEIKNIVSLGNVSYPVLHRDAYNGLVRAIAEAKKENIELLVTSAYRDVKTQKAIWEAKFAETKKQMPAASDADITKVTRKYAAPPSCKSPHLTGKAIDVCIKGSSICQKIDVMYADGIKNMNEEEKRDVLKLKKIMKNAGWKNYTAEWWHYEYNCAECPTVNRE